MRTASPRRSPAATWPRRAAPAPLARAVRTVNRWGLLAGVTGFFSSVLLVVLFTTPVDIGLIFMFSWVFAASRAGWASGRLPRQVANWGVAIGASGLAVAALLTASVSLPAHSLIWDVTYGAGLLASIPVALYPGWLIVLSYRLPGHLAGRAGLGGSFPGSSEVV
jgi:hypothetical protein